MGASEDADPGLQLQSVPEPAGSIWEPLTDHARQIRLLQFLPWKWSNQLIRAQAWQGVEPVTGIQCSLHVVGPDQPEFKLYNALSYAWGDPSLEGTSWVRINGIPIQVSKNLFAAMAAIQFNLDNENERQEKEGILAPGGSLSDWIWIDALCINQKDLEEKSAQVRRMRDIYINAGSVMAWIGEETESVLRIWNFVKQISECYDELEGGHDRALALVSQRHNLLQDLIDLADLFDRPYWKRMWVVQEYTALRNIEVCCGRLRMSAYRVWVTQGVFIGKFGRAVFDHQRLVLLKIPDASLRRRLEDALLQWGPRTLELTNDAISEKTKWTDGWILWLIQNHRWKKAADPRDMVFALAGLFEAMEIKANDWSLPIDYRRSTAQVYVDLTKACVAVSNNLNVWRYLVEQNTDIENLPSWAVDWSAHEVDHLVIRESSGQRADQPCACGTRDQSCSLLWIEVTDRYLRVDGVRVGTIDEVTPKFLLKRAGTDRDLLLEFQSWLQLLTKVGGEDSRKLEAMSRSIHSGTVNDFNDEHIMILMRKCMAQLARLSGEMFADTPPELSSALQSLQEEFEDDPLIHSLDDVKLSMWNSRMAFSSAYAALGKVPATTQVGDILCVLFGCPLVMVFRENADGFFRAVGPSHFDAFMGGKAMRLLEEGKLKVESFYLH